jgi:hypothetical protein
MANIIATNADTNIDLTDGDRLYVPQGVTVISSSNDEAIESDPGNADANGHVVAVDGTIVAFSATAIMLGQDTLDRGQNMLVVGQSGVVRSLNNTSSALYMLGDDSSLQNWGEISGTWGARYEDYNQGLVENHGVITGTQEEAVFFLSSEDITLVNTGLLSGGNGVQYSSSSGSIWNSCQIIATNLTGQALDVGSSTGVDSIAKCNGFKQT